MGRLLKTAVPVQEASITFAEYLQRYADFEGGRSEWLGGAVAVYATDTMSNNTRHQDLLLFLAFVLDLYIARKGLGRILLAGVPMYVDANRPAREPDLMVILNAHLERIKSTFVEGAADIVVEVVSPESIERDRGDKFIEYERAGVQEYWLIDPIHTEARVYRLGEEGRYHPLPLEAESMLISSVLPGFRLAVALLWQVNLPRANEVILLLDQMG